MALEYLNEIFFPLNSCGVKEAESPWLIKQRFPCSMGPGPDQSVHLDLVSLVGMDCSRESLGSSL